MKSISLALAACFCAGLANAKEGEPSATTSPEPAPAASAPAGQTPAAPAPSANAPAAPTPHVDNKPRTENKTRAEGMSPKAYGRVLAAEIRRRTPKVSHHPGSVEVSFTVGAAGKVTSHKVVRASDPALSKIVASILASIQTPPPPGGSFIANQEFTFH